MKLAGILVRVFLVLSLLCNGIGSAYAMATMGAAKATAHHGCHEGAGQPRDVKDQHPAPKRDCCGGVGCACPCNGLVAIQARAWVLVAPSMPAMGVLARPTDSVRASPRLPHLLRPPIG